MVRGRFLLWENWCHCLKITYNLLTVVKVLMQDFQSVNLQVESVVWKANAMLTFILRGVECKNRNVMLRLYKAVARPHLYYCEQFWAPDLRKDMLP